MPRSLSLVFALATLSVGALANGQMVPATNPAGQPYPNVSPVQSNMQQAPIERRQPQQQPQIVSSQPIQGVWLRSEPNASIKTVSANAEGTEIRVEHGLANVQVFHPVSNSQIMVDMPGGQVSLIKDGLYTFNADTNTVAVLRGEADAYVGSDTNVKPVKVKEDHEYAFNGKPKDVDPRMLAADVLPGERGMGEGYNPGYGYGEYGDVPYGYPPYPYYAYGYGYPYGFYPYYGLGFGYYGGFRGGYGGGFGGFRGGGGGGFHGGGGHR